MSVPKGLTRALAVARVAILLVLLPYALDWRSPFLASIRVWAFIGLVAIPFVIVFVEVRALRRAASAFDRALLSASVALAMLCLVCVPCWEAQFWWKRHEVLRADPALPARLGRHVVVGYRDLDELN